MKKTTSWCIMLLFIANVCFAQNGKLLKQNPYYLRDSIVAKWASMIPDVKQRVDQSEFYSISYLSDGLKVNGYLSLPKKSGVYPVIIFNRGGNREFGSLNDAQIIRILALVSSWGYVCIASQYRGNSGSEGMEEFGGKDVNDVVNLIPCLNYIPKADTSRIGMWGWSRGGMMTYLALTQTCRIKAAVVGSGLANAFTTISKRPGMESVFEELAPGYSQHKDSILKARSAVYQAEKMCASTPILILAGTADWRVSPEEQFEMARRLYELKHPVRFELLEGGQHSLAEHFDEVNRATQDFFDQYVRDRKAIPSLEPHGN